ncbi:polysaccharide deacetylase family protein [Georgenia ruanii]|uniref:Polysaccharide deacetylase family protein n=1 Tax=Georgenia ruanii TaxID=348442 RepID=A0A7J9UYU8_9MICO|nr:polysaccharide deacetylase family protein [Georgenia ruanii]
MTRGRLLRQAFLPRLSGVGAPGGIAVSFDDGPDPRGTPAVLEVLEVLGWRVTFFLLGSQVARYPDVARDIVAAGHEIGVHGYLHRNHLARGPLALRVDLERAKGLIGDVTGRAPYWFRPPYGVMSGGTMWAARRAALRPVLWTAWGRDWISAPAEAITATVLRTLRDGGTVLLHDSDCTSEPGSWRGTVRALPLLAAHVQARRWQVRTLTEHVGR